MPKLKREIFLRPPRFTHRFGDNDDPLQSSEYFDMPRPNGIKTVNANGKGGFTGKEKGQHHWPASSPVDKAKGGKASLSGPQTDMAAFMAERPPISTKRRMVTSGAK